MYHTGKCLLDGLHPVPKTPGADSGGSFGSLHAWSSLRGFGNQEGNVSQAPGHTVVVGAPLLITASQTVLFGGLRSLGEPRLALESIGRAHNTVVTGKALQRRI